MRRVLVLLALLGAFALTAAAQTAETPKSTGTKTKAATEAKEAHVTGCISAQPNADGVYTLTNRRYKKGLEVGPSDTVKEHAGHEVELTGKWASAKGIGEKEASGAKETKGEHHFEATNVKMISETCSAPASAAKSKTKKPKGSD